MSIVFNADENRGRVLRGTLTQDFRETHAVCSVVFMDKDRLSISEDDSFFYMGTEWDFVSRRRVSFREGLAYSVLGYPKNSRKLVVQSYGSLKGLADVVGCSFDSGSNDVLFEFPLKGVRLGPLLYKYRYQSFEQNLDSPGNALFLYYDQRGLVRKSYRSLVSENVVDFDPGPLVRTLNIYSVEDEVRNEYRKDPVPRKLSYKQLVTGMVGFKVEVHGVLSGIVGGHYKLRTGEQDLDSLDQMVLVRQRYDSSKGVQPWVLTFGRLEV